MLVQPSADRSFEGSKHVVPLLTCFTDFGNVTNYVFYLTSNSSSKSQVFTLKFGLLTVPVYCHMGDFGCGGGGWTLAMKTDGTKVPTYCSFKFN